MKSNHTDPGEGRPMRVDVSCAAEKPLLAILRRFIASVAEEIGFDGEELIQIEMAVDEACSNAVIHGTGEEDRKADPLPAPGVAPAGLELQITIAHDALTIQIRDHGHEHALEGFKGVASLSEYADPNRPDYKGLGILIMKQFMDEVMFTAIPESGTTVTLCKRRKAK